MSVVSASTGSTTASAASRGERLYPARSSRVYWVLTRLRVAFESVLSQELENTRNATLVDYGCGNMPYRPLFDSRVSKYIGCDFPGNELANIELPASGRLPLEESSIDIVLSSQVLEHVADPKCYLEEAHRVLRPGGALILSTHGIWRLHPDPYDFWRWTSQGLVCQVRLAGFEVQSCRGVMGPAATALQLWQDAVFYRLPSWARKPFCVVLQAAIRAADRMCSDESRDADACVYLVVARKSVDAGL